MDAITNSDQACFVCGQQNLQGLKLTFTYSKNKAHVQAQLGSEYQGWDGILHGGIISTLLDEAMAKAIHAYSGRAVTASLQVRFRRPVPAPTLLSVTGEIIEDRGRLIEAYACAVLADGAIAAEAEGRFLRKG